MLFSQSKNSFFWAAFILIFGIQKSEAQNYCDFNVISNSLNQNQFEIDCESIDSNGCIEVSTEVFPPASTSSYDLQTISFAPVGNLSDGTEINISQDDQWSNPIDLPFNFPFFDNHYNQIIVSDNGMISFNVQQANLNAPFAIASANPNPYLPTNTIFGLFHDLSLDSNTFGCYDDPSTPMNECGQISYQTIGDAPCRSFVINFYNIVHFGCPDSRSSFQVVLYENSGVIEIFIDEKDLSCDLAREQKGLIGIINQNGSLGYSPNGRNNEVFEIQEEGYRFEPNGGAVSYTSRYLSEDNLLAQGNDTQNVCFNEDGELSIEVSYYTAGNSAPYQTLTKTFPVSFSVNFPTSTHADIRLCDTSQAGSQTIDLTTFQNEISQNPSHTITFYQTLANANLGVNPVNVNNVTINHNQQTYYARVENSEGCYTLSQFRIKLDPLPYTSIIRRTCDGDGSGSDDIPNLLQFAFGNDEISLLAYDLSVHATLADAQNNSNPLGGASINSNRSYFIRAAHQNSDCVLFIPYDIIFDGNLEIISQVDLNFCGIVLGPMGYDLTVWEEYISNGNTGLEFSYYNTEEDSFNDSGENQINNPTDYNQSPNQTIYITAKLPIPGVPEDQWCKFYSRIQFTNSANDENVLYGLCDLDGDGQETIHLPTFFDPNVTDVYPENSYNQTLIFTTVENYIRYRYYGDTGGAYPADTFTIDNYYIYDFLFLAPADGTSCDKVVQFILTESPEVVDQLEMCDLLNDGNEWINPGVLIQYDIWNSYPDIYFEKEIFLSYEDAVNGENATEGAFIENQETFYVKFTGDYCSSIEEITLILNPSMETAPIEVSICDVNADQTESFNVTTLYAQSDDMGGGNAPTANCLFFRTLEDAIRLDNPLSSSELENFQVSPASMELFVRNLENLDACQNPCRIVFSFQPESLAVNNTSQHHCSEGVVLHTFDLTTSLPDITPEYNNYPYTFHDSYTNMVNDVEITQSPNAYTSNQSITQVYVKFHLNSGCYSYGIIDLIIPSPPKTIGSTDTACDTDFDGSYNKDLTELNNLIIENTTDLIFNYYTTLNDANNDVNAIANYNDYEFVTATQNIYISAENQFGCRSVTRVTLVGKDIFTLFTPEEPITVCDNDYDGMAAMDLTLIQASDFTNIPNAGIIYYRSESDRDANLNPITDPQNFINDIPWNQTIYVRITFEDECDAPGQFQVVVNPKPLVEISEVLYKCPEDPLLITPQADDDGSYTYQWTNSEGIIVGYGKDLWVSLSGVYTLTTTNSFGCTDIDEVQVEYYGTPVITNLEVQDNQIIVSATGDPVLEYSLNGSQWQTSNVFTNLEEGRYKIYVRSTMYGCDGVPRETIVIEVFNVITPNGDGMNDELYIDNLDVFNGQSSTLKIYDRYGKMIHEQTSDFKLSWNAFYGGRNVPTGSYLYTIDISDGRSYKGFVTVKNY